MSWRTVVIRNRAKLDLKLGYLVIRSEETVRVHLNEIAVLVIESTAVSLTAALVCEMSKRKIKIIFCDEHRNPQTEVIPYFGTHDSNMRVRNQIGWGEDIKGDVWTAVVKEKILNQAYVLKQNNLEEWSQLCGYASEIEYLDKTNREGHAAKVYFNALFGKDFARYSPSVTNAALNYGYSIILSAFNRAVTASGYLTQLGIWHNNVDNHFNLSCDFMEPFRPVVDMAVCGMDGEKFEKEEKLFLVDLLNKPVTIDGKTQYLINAIEIYCRSLFEALEERDISLIKFYEF